MRNRANRELSPGPGKEVDHKTPLSAGGSNSKNNWRVVSRSTNRKKYNKTASFTDYVRDNAGLLIAAPIGAGAGYFYGEEPSILNTLAGTSLGAGLGLGIDLFRKEGLKYFLKRPAELGTGKVLSTAGGAVGGLPGAAAGALVGANLGSRVDDVIFNKKAEDSDFKPDFTPKQLKDMGVYDQVYGDSPSEASMEEWPEHWIHKQDPLGWLQWYERYSKGRRTDDDERQIKRWKSFKSRHLAQYKKNPTERRAAALRNWGIDVKEASYMGPLTTFVKLSEKGVAKKTNPAKWEAAKRQAKAKMGGKHSARAMQLATQIYKKNGGGYSGKKPSAKSNKLKKWTKQDWQWSGERKKEAKSKGVYLPAKAIDAYKSSDSGKAKLRAAVAKKTKATKAGKQFSNHGLHKGKKRSEVYT